ncbi:MAG: ice-binding family protein [Bacteroidia bacterium]
MKNITKNSKITLISSRCFVGTILGIALMMPATAVSQTSPPPVNLGTSGDFVALAKTGISTTGTTSIVGNIGISPNNAAGITGFNLMLDASGQFATSSLVSGKIYASDYKVPTPTVLTAAVGDMQTAYTDAAGRAPNYTELFTGDLTGKTLTTGVYKWSTGVLISAGGVTISGSATDVWIFQIAQNLTVANTAIIKLTGGAKASNIFWQVAGGVSLGTGSDFSGTLLCETLIDIKTGATFKGKALAKTAITLDGNTMTNSTLGIDDIVLENGIVMYPNPGSNNVTIVNSSIIKLDQLAIYDVSGRLINTIDLRGMQKERTVDVSHLTPGVYMLQIQGVGGRTIKRWTKK